MIEISFIVPIFNVESYLERCIHSLTGQSITNIEIICIDDASTDKSTSIIYRLMEEDSRIKLITHEHNQGLSVSRNDGIRKAVGKYVVFVDADDYVESEAFSQIYNLAEKNKTDIVFYHYKDVYEENNVIYRDNGKIVNKYQGIYGGQELLREFILNREFFYFAWIALFTREFIQKNELYFKKMGIGESGEYMLRSMIAAKRVIVSNINAYNYYQRESSIMHSEGAKEQLLLGQIIQYVSVLKQSVVIENQIGIEEFLSYQRSKIHGGIQVASEEKLEIIKNALHDVFGREVFTLLRNCKETYEIAFSNEQVEKIKNNKKIIIYGAGYATPDIIKKVNDYNAEIIGIAVSNRQNNPESIYGHHVFEIEELKNFSDKALVIVGANEKYKKGIRETLNKMSFLNVIYLDISF